MLARLFSEIDVFNTAQLCVPHLSSELRLLTGQVFQEHVPTDPDHKTVTHKS